MRIAWVLYGELTQRTGGTIYDAEVVDGLRAAGDDVRVISLPAPPHEPTPDEAGARRGFRATLPLIAPGARTVTEAIRLVRALRTMAPEVVVGDELCFRELAIAFRLLGKSVTRRVLLVHHLTAWETELSPRRRRVLGGLERLAIGASDQRITTSQTTRKRLIAEGAREPIDVVLPGADRLERVAMSGNTGWAAGENKGVNAGENKGVNAGVNKGVKTSETRFVFVGAVVGRKRVLELVRAFAGGAHARGQLVIVGSTTTDEGYVREVREVIERLGLGPCVRMTGEVDEAGVARALARADVLVMPSSLEGYGIAATEAIRAGIPVIAARAQGLEEALAPCPAAAMFADDEPALARTLARYAREPRLRAAMITAARQAAPRMPTWAGCAQQFRTALLAPAH